MQRLRALIRNHRLLAVWLVALALCMKIMVPSGFMVRAGAQSLSITICDGRGPDQVKRISLPQSGQPRDIPGEQGKAFDACPYAALGLAAVSATPPVLLAAELAFILRLAIRPAPRARPVRRQFLRPPLRAPPAQA